MPLPTAHIAALRCRSASRIRIPGRISEAGHDLASMDGANPVDSSKLMPMQVVLFAEKRLQTALNAWQLIALGGVAAVIRWAVMSTSFSMPLLDMMQARPLSTFRQSHS